MFKCGKYTLIAAHNSPSGAAITWAGNTLLLTANDLQIILQLSGNGETFIDQFVPKRFREIKQAS